jgi:hypothetical protein
MDDFIRLSKALDSVLETPSASGPSSKPFTL